MGGTHRPGRHGDLLLALRQASSRSTGGRIHDRGSGVQSGRCWEPGSTRGIVCDPGIPAAPTTAASPHRLTIREAASRPALMAHQRCTGHAPDRRPTRRQGARDATAHPVGSARQPTRRRPTPRGRTPRLARTAPSRSQQADATEHASPDAPASHTTSPLAAIARACTAAGVPAFSPHDLRHRRISLLHLGGTPWARIGEHLGQRNLATTANTYSHVLTDERELDYSSLQM